jgi:hypothetical protein
MTDTEFENHIQTLYRTHLSPDRDSFANLLSKLDTHTHAVPSPWAMIRYSYLAPVFIILLFVGALALPLSKSSHTETLVELARQTEEIEEPGTVDTDDTGTYLDEHSILDIDLNNETHS